MSEKVDQRLLDINAMVMGGGVGLAALESMFNLVQTQSLLSASMVRDHDAHHVIALEALSLAVGEMLDPGAHPMCRRCRRSRAVNVDIPANQGRPAPPPDDLGSQRGAASGADVLRDMASESRSETTTTNAPAERDPTLEHLLVEVLGLLGGHMKELNDGYRESNRRNLLVT